MDSTLFEPDEPPEALEPVEAEENELASEPVALPELAEDCEAETVLPERVLELLSEKLDEAEAEPDKVEEPEAETAVVDAEVDAEADDMTGAEDNTAVEMPDVLEALKVLGVTVVEAPGAALEETAVVKTEELPVEDGCRLAVAVFAVTDEET